MKRPQIRNHGELAGKRLSPKGSFCFCFSKSEKAPRALPMKYSMIEARLLPVQDTMIPTTGPKMAPFKMTIGSVGIGVADKIPINIIEKRGPAIPVVGIRLSMFFMSLANTTMSTIGSSKVIVVSNNFINFLKDIVMFIIREERSLCGHIDGECGLMNTS